MINWNTDTTHQKGVGSHPPQTGPHGPANHGNSRGGNKVFKSGPLFLSSKGIGWTSWKKRWFILTRTSLVFFRSDPNAVPQRGSEVNLTLGGIDLNNSGSVVVKADKKLLTVLFPDGRDGRAFTLKAETSEDLYEWKAALDEALAQAPCATLVMGQKGVFRKEQADAIDVKQKHPAKSLVLGQPILLALEDIDGTPSFLEKALRFVEEHGVKVEGILRQAADVEDVEHRIREYEKGRNDFSPEEDAHVIADCVKYFLRELPSSPVPASCCKALLGACRTECGRRLPAIREAICETFPEPNRRLLQRILIMMQTVASHKAENRMSRSAVAACMAPLLLRPLLAGDCELEHDFDVGGDGSVQLLQAAAAANHAQAIVITLLEEYENIFGEGSMSSELYSDSEESGSESEELTDYDEDGTEGSDIDYGTEGSEVDDGTEGSDVDVDKDFKHASKGNQSEAGDIGDDDLCDDKGLDDPSLGSESIESDDDGTANQKSLSSSPQCSSTQHDSLQRSENYPNQKQANESGKLLGDKALETSLVHDLTDENSSSCNQNSTTISYEPVQSAQRPAIWGRTPGKKKLSMESVDLPFEDETTIERLEATKIDLQNSIAEEAEGNAVLKATLQSRKNALRERRLALEQDVARLREQLQKEREFRGVLEAGLRMPQGSLHVSSTVDEKTKEELEEFAQMEADTIDLKQTANDLRVQLNQQCEQNCVFAHGSCNHPLEVPNDQEKQKEGENDIETTATSYGRKRSVRTKGTNSKSSPLSRLTNRLNFLKERRSQIANELQIFDRGGSLESRVRGSEPAHNSEKGIGSDSSSQSLQNVDTGVAATEAQYFLIGNTEKE